MRRHGQFGVIRKSGRNLF